MVNLNKDISPFSPWARYENPSPPPLPWGFLKTVIFGHHAIWLFNICLFALKILGHKKILGHQTYVPPWILDGKLNFIKVMLYIFFQLQVFILIIKH